MQEYEFEEFDKTARPAPGKPTVTLQKRGTVGLSGAAFEKLGSPQAITLHFDRKRRVMGLRPASPDKHNAITVRKQARSNSYIFSGIAFANQYGIPLGKARRYLAQPYGDDMLIVDLNEEPGDVSRPPRKQEGEVDVSEPRGDEARNQPA